MPTAGELVAAARTTPTCTGAPVQGVAARAATPLGGDGDTPPMARLGAETSGVPGPPEATWPTGASRMQGIATGSPAACACGLLRQVRAGTRPLVPQAPVGGAATETAPSATGVVSPRLVGRLFLFLLRPKVPPVSPTTTTTSPSAAGATLRPPASAWALGIAPIMAHGVPIAGVHVPTAERLVVAAALPAAPRVAALRPKQATLRLPRAPITATTAALEAMAAPSLPSARETPLRAITQAALRAVVTRGAVLTSPVTPVVPRLACGAKAFTATSVPPPPAKAKQRLDRLRVGRPVVLATLDVPRQAAPPAKRGPGTEGQATNAIPVTHPLIALPDEVVLGGPSAVVTATTPLFGLVPAQIGHGATAGEAMPCLPVPEVAPPRQTNVAQTIATGGSVARTETATTLKT